MSDIRIEVLNGAYTNSDVYENLINYIGTKEKTGCYGCWGTALQDYADQFHIVQNLSEKDASQDIWHFIISFQRISDKYVLFTLANQIASLFKNHYQIIFAVDTEGSRFHLHFGVNAYSYFPEYPSLTDESMLEYMQQIQNFLSIQYPTQTITLQFKQKRRR